MADAILSKYNFLLKIHKQFKNILLFRLKLFEGNKQLQFHYTTKSVLSLCTYARARHFYSIKKLFGTSVQDDDGPADVNTDEEIFKEVTADDYDNEQLVPQFTDTGYSLTTPVERGFLVEEYGTPRTEEFDKICVEESVVEEVKRLFKIEEPLVKKMFYSQKFLLVGDSQILETLQFLYNNKLSSEQLLRCSWILLQSVELLNSKCRILSSENMFEDVAHGLGFCRFNVAFLKFIQNCFRKESEEFPDHGNRFYYMSERLQIPVSLLVEKSVAPKHIINMPKIKIDAVIDILKYYKVTSENILKDMWIFYHNADLMEERFRMAVESGYASPKPWMARCPLKIIERTLERCKENHEMVHKYGSNTKYLAAELNCSESIVMEAIAKRPQLIKCSALMLQRKIDLLRSEGFSSDQILNCMHILCYSEERTRERLEKLKALGYRPRYLAILYTSKRRFEALCAKLKKFESKEMYNVEKISVKLK